MRKLILIVLVFAGCKNPNYCDGAGYLENNCNERVSDGNTGDTGSGSGSDGPQCSATKTCATGVCDLDTSKCVECIDNSTCSETSSTPACYGDVCTLCEKHSDCPTSNTCLPDGTCALQSDVAYVDGTAGTTNATCGKTTPCLSLNAALLLSTKYVHVSNTVNEVGIPPINVTKTIIGDRDGSNNITSKLTDTAAGGTVITFNNATSSNFTFYDIAFVGTATTGDAIFVGSSSTTGITLNLTRCLVDGVAGEGVDMSKGTLIVDRSKISNNAGGGVDLSNTNYTFINTYVVHNGTGAGAQVGGMKLSGGSGTIGFLTVASNVGTVAGGSFGIWCVGTAGVVTNTLLSSNSAPQNDAGCSYAYSGVPGATGTNVDSVTNVNTNVDTNYHLTPSSTMIDKANSTTVKIDWDGDVRPFGNAPDIGADERNN